MKLHWSPRSPYVRKVMIVAHETGVADRLELVRSVVAMSKPNHDVLRDNPLGRIPTLVTGDGTILFDSAVICEYLDSLHTGPKLFPPAGAERWHALRWHALGDGMLDTLIVFRNEREQPPAQQNPDWLANFALKIARSLDAIERETAALDAAPFGSATSRSRARSAISTSASPTSAGATAIRGARRGSRRSRSGRR